MSTAPFAMKVLATPMPVFSHSSRSCLLARLRMQPLPARMIGRLALRMQFECAVDDLVVGDRAAEAAHLHRLGGGVHFCDVFG